MHNPLVIFDLDGVLIDSKKIHFDSLNIALGEIDNKFIISEEDQENLYEGLPTRHKLKLLSEIKQLDPSLHDHIWRRKQEISSKMFESLERDNDLIFFMDLIKSNNIFIAVASNSIKKTIESCLNSLGIIDYIDCIISNEDVVNPKPHPEMYWKAMSALYSIPEYTTIFEDSPVGILAARSSMCNLIEIKNRKDLDIIKINNAIDMCKKNKGIWVDKKINILIPMAGQGSRFSEQGYVFPKPLIDVQGEPMIKRVVDSLGIDAKYNYVVQKEHYEKYNLKEFLENLTPGCEIFLSDGITEGAAITCLLAEKVINSENPLIICNSDQIIEWDSREFMYSLLNKNADGGIAVFNSNHPKWSYAKISETGLVVEVAEKKNISNLATVGVYYWKKGSDFVKYAKSMIDKDIRTNNEFYVCPVFNEAISENKKIYTHLVDKMWGVGTPEDLRYYCDNNIS